MLRAMDSAVAGLRAHQNKLDVIGNNIANVNTAGFKSQAYTFKDAMYQTSTTSTAGAADGKAGGMNPAQYGYGALTGTISTDMTAGTPSYVGGFNASINGVGFFMTGGSANVADNTQILYTRVGQLSVDSAGYIVDGNGNYLYGLKAPEGEGAEAPGKDPAPAKGKDMGGMTALKVPDTNNKPTVLQSVQIDNNGFITGIDTNGKAVKIGHAALATFQNPAGLTKAGNNTYSHTDSDNAGTLTIGTPGMSGLADLMSGYLESSNVDLAKEFSDMITTERGFQANSKIITVSDEVLQELVNMKR